MNIITEYHRKQIEKAQKYAKKQRERDLKDVTPREHKTLKSSLTQAYCHTALLIECLDTIFEIQQVEKHYPIMKDFLNEMVKLNSELYKIGVKTEEDERNRVDFERMIGEIAKPLPELSIKQLEILREYITNLK